MLSSASAFTRGIYQWRGGSLDDRANRPDPRGEVWAQSMNRIEALAASQIIWLKLGKSIESTESNTQEWALQRINQTLTIHFTYL